MLADALIELEDLFFMSQVHLVVLAEFVGNQSAELSRSLQQLEVAFTVLDIQVHQGARHKLFGDLVWFQHLTKLAKGLDGI